MSLFSKISNKLQYLLSKQLSDPEAEAYAKQQAAQAIQDAKVAKEKKELDAKNAKKEADKIKQDKEAEALVARSKINPKKFINDTTNGILTAFMAIIITSVCLYGGSLLANKSIGYNAPFRLLSFVYGYILFFYYIPKSFYDVYKGIPVPYYCFLPLSNTRPEGYAGIFLSPFCYDDDDSSIAAKSSVTQLYADAYSKSQKMP